MSLGKALLLALLATLAPVALMAVVVNLDDYPMAKVLVLALAGAAFLIVVRWEIKRNRQAEAAPAPRVLDDEAGWAPLRAALERDMEVAAGARGVELVIVQMKEKWGELRVYFSLVGEESLCAEAKAQIRKLIEAAEKKSAVTCIRCGRPAQMGKLGGRMLPLCPEHLPADAPVGSAVGRASARQSDHGGNGGLKPALQPAPQIALQDGVPLLLQQWEESEREEGWGVTVRPDGFSVHRTPAALDAYLKDYWQAMPDKEGGRAPDLYSRPSGDPVAVTVAPNHPLMEALAGKDSLRLTSWDEETRLACLAAEQLWHAVAVGRGWHVDRDWPKDRV